MLMDLVNKNPFVTIITYMAFQATVQTEESTTIVHFEGALDEHAILPSDLGTSTDIHVDLDGLSYINSVGVRLWIRWLTDVSKKHRLFLIRCPVLVVKNFSSIRGMLNKNTIVQSFYVPYYDEVLDERKNALFIRGKHFMEDGHLNMPVLTDSNGRVMEPDVIEQTYFSFLKL